LGALGPPPVSVTLLEGLEGTRGPDVGEVATELVEGLEATRAAEVPALVEPLAELDHHQAAPVGEIPLERLELMVDRAPDDGPRSPPPSGVVACRYCRHVQAAGTLCEACGMRLPIPFAAAPTRPAREPVSTRCRACGAPATAGERCGDCGHEVAFPDA
jgi:hypothetical protein